jgi:osmotically-inducible protein OsmY
MSMPADSDLDVQSLVYDELEWTPEVDAAGIGVAVDGGAVTLSGEVESYAERLAANRAAFRVRGVRAVVDNITVHPKGGWPVTETDVAKNVEHALEAASNVPDSVHAQVREHVVTLTGEVEWDYQRRAARRAVQFLDGVYTVRDDINLSSRPTAADTQDRIARALVRNAQLDAHAITVAVEGGKVTLIGTVRSAAERVQAEQAAWASPHVTEIDNRIAVRAR